MAVVDCFSMPEFGIRCSPPVCSLTGWGVDEWLIILYGKWMTVLNLLQVLQSGHSGVLVAVRKAEF